MALELNEQHLEILTEVREKLRERLIDPHVDKSDGGEYICVQVLQALGRRCGIEKATRTDDLTDELLLQFNELADAITQALNLSCSVGTYVNRLRLKIGVWALFDEVAPLARLAWLDRMLETKVLA